MNNPIPEGRLKRLRRLEFPDDWMALVLFTVLTAAGGNYPRASALLTMPVMVGITAAILAIAGAALMFKRTWGWMLMLVLLYLPLTAILVAEHRYLPAGIYLAMMRLCWQRHRRPNERNFFT